jgi:NTE family protein
MKSRRVALALGGGGMKGFAHIGVIRALEELGITPSVYAGTSIGALIAAARAGGATVDVMAERATRLKRRDLFRLNHVGMLLERMRAPSIYLEEPLRALIAENVPNCRLNELPKPALISTVDVERGSQIAWGLPGLDTVSTQDAVYASCALPGFFPPGKVNGRLCIDGGTIDNLPAAVTSLAADVIIAVDVGSSELSQGESIAAHGFAATYMRAATVMMHALQLYQLTQWDGPPMVLVRPRIGHVGWLQFGDTPALIDEGYRAAKEALKHFEEVAAASGGVFPRRRVRVEVDRAKCIGCSICVSMAPQLMALDAQGKATTRTMTVTWSPADGEFIHHCPTNALAVVPARRSGQPTARTSASVAKRS